MSTSLFSVRQEVAFLNSPKHLHRYVNEFAGKHNVRELDTIEQMEEVIRRMAGRRLSYHQLVAPNGLSNAAHS